MKKEIVQIYKRVLAYSFATPAMVGVVLALVTTSCETLEKSPLTVGAQMQAKDPMDSKKKEEVQPVPLRLTVLDEDGLWVEDVRYGDRDYYLSLSIFFEKEILKLDSEAPQFGKNVFLDSFESGKCFTATAVNDKKEEKGDYSGFLIKFLDDASCNSKDNPFIDQLVFKLVTRDGGRVKVGVSFVLKKSKEEKSEPQVIKGKEILTATIANETLDYDLSTFIAQAVENIDARDVIVKGFSNLLPEELKGQLSDLGDQEIRIDASKVKDKVTLSFDLELVNKQTGLIFGTVSVVFSVVPKEVKGETPALPEKISVVIVPNEKGGTIAHYDLAADFADAKIPEDYILLKVDYSGRTEKYAGLYQLDKDKSFIMDIDIWKLTGAPQSFTLYVAEKDGTLVGEIQVDVSIKK